MLDTLFTWLATYLVHSTVLLVLAWCLDRAGLLRGARLAERVWRFALFGAVLTATLHAPAQRALRELLRVNTSAVTAAPPPALQPSAPIHAVAPAPAAATPIPSPRPTEHAMIELPAPGEGGSMVAVFWLLLAAAGCGHTLWTALQLKRQAGRDPLAADAEMLAFLAASARRHGRKPPPLRITRRWNSPLVAPGGDICVPAWALAELTPAQREAMLAHEFAHVLRRDPAWRLAAQLLVRLAWCQPLNRLALRRLDHAAELRCDEWAAAAGGRRRELAEALYACAQVLGGQYGRHGATPQLAAAMARDASPLLQRIGALMAESPALLRKPLFGAALLVTIALGAAVAALPDLSFGGAANHTRITSSDGEVSTHVSIEGEVVWNDAEDDVKALTDVVTISQKKDNVLRTIRFTPDPAQGVLRHYAVNGSKAPFDADARAWLAQVLPSILRETESAGATDKRIARLMAKGGMPLVMADLGKISSGHVRSRYVMALATRGQLAQADFNQALASLNGSGDFERKTAYKALLAGQQPDELQHQALLAAVAAMQSDFDQHEVLVAIAPQLGDSPVTVVAWKQALATIQADHDAGQALAAMAARSTVPPGLLIGSLEASARLHASFDKATALKHFAPHLSQPAAQMAYLQGAATIAGDERADAVLALIEGRKLDQKGYAQALRAMAEGSSNYALSRVMLAVAERMPAAPELVALYRQTARQLGEHERGKVEKALDHLNV